MNRQRTLGWLAFLAIAGALAWGPKMFFDEGQDPGEASATAASPANAGKVRSAAVARQAVVKPLNMSRDLFAAKSWKPAPTLATVTEQAAPVLPEAVAPSAPPLPFQFIGRMDDQRDLQVFLQNGEKLYVVRIGDVIDDTYRIEHISATELSLVYLPLHLSQTLSVGSTP
ncbi:hypothetical protein [Pseudomonas fluorescens]|uniref:Secretion system X translation initiation factor n=1 Tax=Pseudomonas fluorescens TaxID=294 RepID=A0A5E7FGN5_PSEFL|nr:hypothetical protein [Pseudomonas fluorescens]VVO38356.1 hypothetical protein PS691_05506 [Pseudomonas fluorescens]